MVRRPRRRSTARVQRSFSGLLVALLAGLLLVGLVPAASAAQIVPPPTPTPDPGSSSSQTTPANPTPDGSTTAPDQAPTSNGDPAGTPDSTTEPGEGGDRGETVPGAVPLPPPGVQEPTGQTCFIIVDKVDPGETASDVVGSGCHTGAAKTPPAQVPTEPQTDPAPRFRAQEPSAAAAAASVPIMEVYAGTNYGGKSFIVYGNQGPCDASGYTISDATDINDTVGGASSYRTYNGCDNHKIYNQTDLRGTPAAYVGSGISALPAAYDNKVASVKLRTNCSSFSQTGKSVCGAIRDKYETLGGPASLGYPTSNELTNPDNVGKRNTFQGGSSIYWSPNTPASQIGGAIYNKWGQLGYEAGTLGYPTTDETTNTDRTGKNNKFAKNGAIFWSSATGANMVQGPMLDWWGLHNYESGLLGYPMTDPLTNPDGAGKRQQFTKSRYLYWSQATGAHDVGARTMPMWEGDGYEGGAYGYPTEDEQPSSNGKSAMARFANGFYVLGAVNINSQSSAPAPSNFAQRQAQAAPQDEWIVNVAVDDPHPSKGAETAGVPTVVLKSRCFLTGPTPLTIHQTGLLRSAPGTPDVTPTSGYTVRSTSAYDQVCQNNTGKTPGQTWYTPQLGAAPVNGTGWYDGGAAMDCPAPPPGSVQISEGIKLSNKRYYVNP